MKRMYNLLSINGLIAASVAAFTLVGCQETTVENQLSSPSETSGNSLRVSAESEFVEGELLIQFKEGVSDAAKQKEVSTELGYENLPLAGQDAYTLFKGKDSPDAPGGYRGRVGIYEVFDVSKEIQDLILKRSTSAEIETLARSQGMVTMRQDGYFKALNGQTTLTEVNRVAAADNA